MGKPLNKLMAKSSNGEDITFYRNQEGINYSAYPPQTFLTFEYWIFMVPQYKPKSVLMLGYGAGTVAGLIRLIWGDDVPITAVDVVPPEDGNIYGVDFIQADAKEFVKDCGSFDAVLVDLFDNEKARNCEFVTDPDFVESLERIGNYLIINGMDLDMSAYEHFKLMGVNKSQSGVLIYYYETRNKIPYLHPYK
ncbi:MAG: hypothetical protein Q7R49_06070 [Candidatus Daviesbacteria bacterium]|nr:hypothetical protein [Candidatus Daviesbacteria bacterium]